MPDLWHVALRERLPGILEHGLKSGLPGSEQSIAVLEWEQRTGLDVASREGREQFWEDAEDWEYDPSERARDKLNDLLPGHDRSVFFWTTEAKAEQARKIMKENTHHDFVVIGVDSSAMPGVCVVGDNVLADEIFDELHVLYHEGVGSEEEEWAVEEKVEKMAERYKQGMEPYTGQEEPHLEVVCPVDVPKDAIVSIDGYPVQIHPAQRTIREFKSRGKRGWPREPRRHALAARGIETRGQRRV